MPIKKEKNPSILVRHEVFRKTADALKMPEHFIRSPNFLRFLANEVDEKKYARLSFICRKLEREGEGERGRYIIGAMFAKKLAELNTFHSVAAIAETILTGIRHLPAEERDAIVNRFYKYEEKRMADRNIKNAWKFAFGD